MVNDMWIKMKPVVIGRPYPVVSGNGWRSFDGERWHDCDMYGNIKQCQNCETKRKR